MKVYECTEDCAACSNPYARTIDTDNDSYIDICFSSNCPAKNKYYAPFDDSMETLVGLLNSPRVKLELTVLSASFDGHQNIRRTISSNIWESFYEDKTINKFYNSYAGTYDTITANDCKTRYGIPMDVKVSNKDKFFIIVYRPKFAFETRSREDLEIVYTEKDKIDIPLLDSWSEEQIESYFGNHDTNTSSYSSYDDELNDMIDATLNPYDEEDDEEWDDNEEGWDEEEPEDDDDNNNENPWEFGIQEDLLPF